MHSHPHYIQETHETVTARAKLHDHDNLGGLRGVAIIIDYLDNGFAANSIVQHLRSVEAGIALGEKIAAECRRLLTERAPEPPLTTDGGPNDPFAPDGVPLHQGPLCARCGKPWDGLDVTRNDNVCGNCADDLRDEVPLHTDGEPTAEADAAPATDDRPTLLEVVMG